MARSIAILIALAGMLAGATAAAAQTAPSPAPYGWNDRVPFAPAQPQTSGRVGAGAGSTNWYDRTSELSGG